jgi:hypothetical protein
MRRMASVALVCLLIAALAPTGVTEEAQLALVRVRVVSADQAAFLLTRFDETHNHHHGFLELLLWPGDEERLRATGFTTRSSSRTSSLAISRKPPLHRRRLPCRAPTARTTAGSRATCPR